jgi:hypothetical protein
MRQRPTAIRRYALARPGIAGARPEERIQRLRLVRMEAIAELDRSPSPSHRLEKK